MCPTCCAVGRTRLAGTCSCVSASRTVGLCGLLRLVLRSAFVCLVQGFRLRSIHFFSSLGIGSSCSCHVCVVSVVVVIVNTIATRLAALTALCRHLSSHRALAQSYHCPAPTTNVQQRQRAGISHASADTLLAEANAGVVAGALLQHAAEPHSRTAVYQA